MVKKLMKKRSGGTLAGVLLSIGVVAVIVAVIIAIYVGGYNKAVNLEQAVKSAWGNVDAALQRRLDLVPNLVNTVKGYATHEKELFENIAKSREKYFAANSAEGKIQATGELSGLLSRLMMLQENYPELKASENFRDLAAQLEGTENRINYARRVYNEAVQSLNGYERQIFGSWFCKKANVKPASYFEASEEAKTTVPAVEF